ncbi:adenosylhomocysteinase (plasmid) [Phaeobacter sp. BS23]|uniref:adenosylhomocysteinase n=1 Tax=Phaeobacter sp. BS23 TaxID=2907239 RepID=UPI003703790C
MSDKSGKRIDWVAASCALLNQIKEEFRETKPFDGITIGTGIHLEPKTVALLMTLKAGGARVVASGNLSSTQPDCVDYLRANGITVHAEQTTDPARHQALLQKVLAEEPQLLLDNGGDLFALYLDAPYPGLIGGTEETTSGRMRLEPLRDRLNMPILVINDSPIKQYGENRHAVGQSMFESFMRVTNRSTNGKHVTVFGYGPCGEGVATCFRNAFSIVSVVEVDPVRRLEAHLDGFLTPTRAEAIASADVLVTETGARNVLTAADLSHFKDSAILMNGGHFPDEIDAAGLVSSEDVATRQSFDNGALTSLSLKDGRTITIVTMGHMANLAGPRPLGNSIESMDFGFALQAKCLERVASGQLNTAQCIVPVPCDIDEWVANAYLSAPE